MTSEQRLLASTVADCASLCLKSFQICQEKAAIVHPRELSLVNDQFARFSRWVSNIRVFTRSRGSLDYRLHEASDVHEAVTGILEALNFSVQNCSDMIHSLSQEAPDHELIDVDEKLQQTLQNIADEIGSLHKLSNTIRKANKETQSNRAAETFIIRDDEGNDAGPFLQSVFLGHILDKYGRTSETIQERLAHTMLTRRKRILHLRTRYGMTSIQSLNPPAQPSLLRPKANPTFDLPERHFDALGQHKAPRDASKSIVRSVTPTATHSATQSATQTATTLSPEIFLRIASTPSAISTSKTVALNSHEELRFPPAPCGSLSMRYRKRKRECENSHKIMFEFQYESLQTDKNVLSQHFLVGDLAPTAPLSYDWSEYIRTMGELTCPSRLNALPVEDEVDENKWRLHVKNDLDPYVCLFEECDCPENIYSHSDEWLRHMREHTLRWRCLSKSHGELIYNTRDEYIKHMKADHAENVTNAQLETLARRNARNIGPIFTSCPLCLEFNDADGDIEHHIVGHMRSLALKSLPSYDEDIEGLSDLCGDGQTSTGSKLRTRSTVGQSNSSHGGIEPVDADLIDEGATNADFVGTDTNNADGISVDALGTETGDFLEYLQNGWKKGIDIDQNISEYFAEDMLQKYWTVAKVSETLDKRPGGPMSSSIDEIKESYIRVWSTLVLTGYSNFINWFRRHMRNDDFFYVSGFNATAYLDQDPSLQAMLDAFGKYWWKFWPVRFQSSFMYQRRLESKRVLPVTSCHMLVPSSSLPRTTIYEVDLDPSCCEYSHTKVVFKVYNDTFPEARQAFAKEVGIFDALGRGSRDVIVEYLGSFIQNERSVLILEHANGGNLRDFFDTHRPPRNNDEQIYLWSKLFKLLDAVYHLQHPGGYTAGIVHRDIKFENILYFKKGHPDAFEFDFKLTDFDASTPLQIIQDGFSLQDNDGSRTHSAPEASRLQEATETKSEQVPINSDIWQLGCVFSEALICTIWGIDALLDYEERRRRETRFSPDLVNGGYEICFHDGQNRLPCVQAIHQEALASRAAFDTISQQVAKLIVNEMLVPHKGRAQPEQLTAKFEKLLADIRIDSLATGILPQRSGQEQIRIHTESSADGNLSQVHPTHIKQKDLSLLDAKVSELDDNSNIPDPNSNPQNGLSPAKTDGLAQGATYIKNDLPQMMDQQSDAEALTKANHRTLQTKEESRTEPPWVTADDVELWRMNKKKTAEIPDGLRQIIQELIGRDQLFVIDDAISMKTHLPNIIRVAKAMISLAKKADPNGVELIFTSKPDQIKKKRLFNVKSETNHLVDQINSRFADKSLPMSTNMEYQLGTILERFTSWSRAKTSVYVFTDGVWKDSPEPGGGVEGPIKTLITRLKERSQNRTDVTIQFIRFGDDKIGSGRLKWLDDDLPKLKPEWHDFDIVDTRRHGDNLFLLMIGALRRSIDEAK